MKSTLKRIIKYIVNNDVLWIVIKPFAKFGFFAFHNRKQLSNVSNHENDPYLYIFKKNEVLHGPFKGMKYPSFSSAGSSFFPKLLGSYEKELHGLINNLLSKSYTEILDIGCAEGYYAIGFALKSNLTKIYAYDTDKTARDLCYQMAKINTVDDRVTIKETCTPKELKNLKFTGKALIICDCEGYEQHLFDETNVGNLKNCDLLIETHDFIDLNISGNLIGLFSKTHNIQIIKSIDDIEKAKTYSYDETDSLNLDEKLKLFREYRPSIMEWLICTPKAIDN